MIVYKFNVVSFLNNKQSIIKFCNEIGIDLVGFSKMRIYEELRPYYLLKKKNNLFNEFEEKDIEKKINPFYYMKDGKTIITLAFPYKYTTPNYEKNYFSIYTLGMDYHKVISIYLKKVCNYIQSIGGKSIFLVDNNNLPERYIASQSGIGFIGKNNILITKKYGSYVFLGEIITDLDIEPDIPMIREQGCGNCNLCIEACPTKCLNYHGEANFNKCLSYITQKKDIDDKWLFKFGGRLFGCDTCQRVCPHNYNVEISNINEFKPFDFMINVNEEEILNMNNKTFNELYRKTSCGWRGKNILKRNTLINLANNNEIKLLEEMDMRSPYIKEYYYRLLKLLNL